jgi:hypothetical protein
LPSLASLKSSFVLVTGVVPPIALVVLTETVAIAAAAVEPEDLVGRHVVAAVVCAVYVITFHVVSVVVVAPAD